MLLRSATGRPDAQQVATMRNQTRITGGTVKILAPVPGAFASNLDEDVVHDILTSGALASADPQERCHGDITVRVEVDGNVDVTTSDTPADCPFIRPT